MGDLFFAPTAKTRHAMLTVRLWGMSPCSLD